MENGKSLFAGKSAKMEKQVEKTKKKQSGGIEGIEMLLNSTNENLKENSPVPNPTESRKGMCACVSLSV